ncbi:MAG: HupE/UreJ family protein [Aquabacterium sp.]|nr:HupE/UreJ family protein [Aquabacterium sp.]
MSAGQRWRRLCLAFWLALLGGAPAGAHEMSMAEMTMHETARGEFIWQWTAGMRAGSGDLRPAWPTGCDADANILRCGSGGLAGTLAMDGVGKDFSAVLVKLHWLDGGMRVYTITAGQPRVQLYGSADDKRGMGEIASAYALLGMEHILGGFDHLLFVISLLFLVGFRRQLVWTISAFTLAHSITLALSALGWLVLRPPPVEATIALSIMLVAGEALHQRDTLARRWPALVAFLFGLVHGLGFAGALKEIGLPDNHLLVALLTFNLGVEAGQLLTVAAAGLVYLVLRRLPVLPPAPARVAALYGIGALAAYWSIERIAAILA